MKSRDTGALGLPWEQRARRIFGSIGRYPLETVRQVPVRCIQRAEKGEETTGEKDALHARSLYELESTGS